MSTVSTTSAPTDTAVSATTEAETSEAKSSTVYEDLMAQSKAARAERQKKIFGEKEVSAEGEATDKKESSTGAKLLLEYGYKDLEKI